MHFTSSDIAAAVKRGLGPNDPRMFPFLQEHSRARRIRGADDSASGVLYGAKRVADYPTASDWLRMHPDLRAPVWLGHNPVTSVYERGVKRFVRFNSAGSHPAMVFEILGRNFRRLS